MGLWNIGWRFGETEWGCNGVGQKPMGFPKRSMGLLQGLEPWHTLVKSAHFGLVHS